MYCSSRPKSTHKKCMFILTTPSLLLADRLVKIPEVASGDGAAHYGESVYMIFFSQVSSQIALQLSPLCTLDMFLQGVVGAHH